LSARDFFVISPVPGHASARRASARKAAASTNARIARDHFAFLRGWLQGLQPRPLWQQYLQRLGPWDERRGRNFLRDLLHELAAVARRSGRPDFAGLLQRHKSHIANVLAAGSPRPQAGAAAPSSAPSLEEFAAQFDPDMYSEAELIELWQEAHATPPPGKRLRQDAMTRRARLIERQLEALDWLERLACDKPRPADPTLAWLSEKVCARLLGAGIETLGQLHEFVGRHGANWHKKVDRIGAKGAEVIGAWLRNQQDSLGALPSTALLPAAQAQQTLAGAAPAAVTALVPLERLALPALLATADPEDPRANRAPPRQCKINAVDDYQAVAAWLGLRDAKSHTWRAYRREAERFLLWSVFEAGKPLSALTALDCVAYRDFLRAPGMRWVGRRSSPRWSPLWRPFEGPLSAASIQTATVILKSMCEWLARRRYLDTNPWDGVPAAGAGASMPSSRALSLHQWQWVEAWLATLPQDARSARVRMLLGFGYRTGMRLAELAAARVQWLRHEQIEDGSWAWSIMVLGKRNKWREVALPSSAVVALSDFFARRGLRAQLLENPPHTPLIASLALGADEGDRGHYLTPGRIYEIVKDSFERCAAWVAPQDSKAAARIRQASTHWLRHTYGTHAAQVAPLHVLKEQMGHASTTTTAGYTRTALGERQKAMQRAFG